MKERFIDVLVLFDTCELLASQIAVMAFYRLRACGTTSWGEARRGLQTAAMGTITLNVQLDESRCTFLPETN